MKNDSIVWMVGQYKSGKVPNVIWEFHGIFLTKEEAVENCKTENFFICPVIIGAQFPVETCTSLYVEYPLLGSGGTLKEQI